MIILVVVGIILIKPAIITPTTETAILSTEVNCSSNFSQLTKLNMILIIAKTPKLDVAGFYKTMSDQLTVSTDPRAIKIIAEFENMLTFNPYLTGNEIYKRVASHLTERSCYEP